MRRTITLPLHYQGRRATTSTKDVCPPTDANPEIKKNQIVITQQAIKGTAPGHEGSGTLPRHHSGIVLLGGDRQAWPPPDLRISELHFLCRSMGVLFYSGAINEFTGYFENF